MSSLKQFIRDSKEIRELFASALPVKEKFSQPQLASPPCKYSPQEASCIGTAFDYLLRFHAQRNNRSIAYARKWVAEDSIDFLKEGVELECGIVREQLIESAAKGQQILTEGKKQFAEFLISGLVTEGLIQSALAVATLDPIARAGVGEESIGQYPCQGEEDLRRLFEIVPSAEFTAKNLCLLNPVFNESPDYALGADADLVLDETIIDIKTTNQLRLNRSDVDQLLGYFLLNELVGFAGVAQRQKIMTVGIYFSRYAYLYKLPIRNVLSEAGVVDLANFFQKQAIEYSPQDLDWKPHQPSK